MSDYPTLDGDRSTIDDIGGRTVLDDEFTPLTPHVDEIDTYCELPVRITHNSLSGVTLELGPYDLQGADIDTLRAAINAIDHIEGTTPWRAVR